MDQGNTFPRFYEKGWRRGSEEKLSEILSDAAGSSAGDSGEIGGARRSLELKVMGRVCNYEQS